MIYVLMTSELPWQRKDTITFFTCLCISRYQVFFFSEWIMAKFEQIIRQRFGNILKRCFKGHKNS